MRFGRKHMMLIPILLGLVPVSSASGQTQIDLAGTWQVRLDPRGEHSPSHDGARNRIVSQPVRLPGALRDSGLGAPVGPNTSWIGDVRRELLKRPEYAKHQNASDFKMPFWLQPERHYVGSAYYERQVEIPESWHDRRVLLAIERPHWQTEVWIDGTRAGADDSLSTPHVYDLTQNLAPGRHTLCLRVDNSLGALDVGINSHSVSDHTQTAWHGIVGRIELRAEPPIAIEGVQANPAEDARSARVALRVVNKTGAAHGGTITLRAAQDGSLLAERSISLPRLQDGATVEYVLPFEREAKRWDEFAPNLCQLDATLQSDTNETVSRRIEFGVRHLKTQGTRFVLNGRPLFLRGTLECCIFPLTGYPPTEVDPWKRIIRICKAHGLNHIRFHSWCPPEAAFAAADELGFYFQVECSTWPNQSTSLGDGRPIDKWLYREGQCILDTYGNHPSFLLLAMGNEPAGPQQGGKYLGPWVDHFKGLTDRQLVTSGSGWPIIAENEYHVTPSPRIQQWGQGLRSRINGQPPATVADYRDFVGRYQVPVISHEIGQWCVYPNFDEMKKYTGALKPRNFEIFQELLRDAKMPDQARDFLMASGKLQTLCYKEEIESALRTPGFGGFQLLDLHDFPGQGTALVGILDPFWDSKPYVTPEEFSHFCSPTVPLAKMPKRTWTNEETFVADVEISHFGPTALHDATPAWTISRKGEVIASGELGRTDIATGQLTPLGRVTLPLAAIEGPTKLTLRIAIAGIEPPVANDWDFWVYPSRVETAPPAGVLLVHQMSGEAQAALNSGKTVVLMADPTQVVCDVQIGFSSIFWNTAWTGGQAPQTLGILCDPSHPALADFVTDYHSNWQWWELVSRSRPMALGSMPTDVRPIVQVVPDWFRPQRLGLVFEVKVGPGKLLVSSIDLERDLDTRPVARQLRHSLLQYAASSGFDPKTRVGIAAIQALFREPGTLQRIGATIEADSAHRDYPATNAVDGDPDTFWHTDWEPAPAPMPHALILDLKAPRLITGLRYVPRQDMTNGRIAEYAVQLSDDGLAWGDPVASGKLPTTASPRVIQFAQPRSSRYVKLTVLRAAENKPHASAAEIDIITPSIKP